MSILIINLLSNAQLIISNVPHARSEIEVDL